MAAGRVTRCVVASTPPRFRVLSRRTSPPDQLCPPEIVNENSVNAPTQVAFVRGMRKQTCDRSSFGSVFVSVRIPLCNPDRVQLKENRRHPVDNRLVVPGQASPFGIPEFHTSNLSTASAPQNRRVPTQHKGGPACRPKSRPTVSSPPPDVTAASFGYPIRRASVFPCGQDVTSRCSSAVAMSCCCCVVLEVATGMWSRASWRRGRRSPQRRPAS